MPSTLGEGLPPQEADWSPGRTLRPFQVHAGHTPLPLSDSRTLAEALPQPVCVTDASGALTYCNQAWQAFTGFSEEETIRSGWGIAVHPEDEPAVNAAFAESMRTEGTFSVELRLRRHDGCYRWHAARGLPLRSGSGELIGWLGTSSDIDDYRRREMAQTFLAEASRVLSSSLEYETTLDAVAQLAVSHLADWCTVHIVEPDHDPSKEPKCVTIAHRDPRAVKWAWSLQGRFPYDGNAPQGLPNVLRTGKGEIYPEITDEMLVASIHDPELLQIYRNLGLTSVMVVPMVARDRILGVITFYYSEVGRHYSDDDLRLAEDLASSAAMAVDNARLYRDSREAERRIALLAEAGAVLAASLDPADTVRSLARLCTASVADGCMLFLTEEDGTLTGRAASHVDPEQELLLEAFTRVHISQPGRQGNILGRALASKSPIHLKQVPASLIEAAVSDPLAKELMIRIAPRSVIVAPLLARGRALGALIILQNVSKQPLDEDDVTLVEAIAHRASLALDNAHLYARAREMDQRKDQFVAMLAHELRNPLSAIRYAITAMDEIGFQDEAQEKHKDVIDRQSTHLSRMVEDLLDVSRITRGLIQLKPQAVPAAQVVAQAIESCRHQLDERSQELVQHISEESLTVEVDSTRMSQVICNLLGNASKYTPRGGQVHLRLESDPATAEAVIRVSDTGRGIAPEVLPRIFDLFVQADHSLARSEGGLGIGLTVVKHLVELQGGRVEANSAGLGNGSEFVVRLPLSEASTSDTLANALLPEEPNSWRAKGSPASDRPFKVLVVDDNRDAAESLGDLLDLWGFEGLLAFDGPSAIRAAEEFRPDVVLLDIGLPGMDGFEVARTLRANAACGGNGWCRYLIAVTGYGQEDDRRQSQEAGFDHHLTKPVDPATIRELLAAAAQS